MLKKIIGIGRGYPLIASGGALGVSMLGMFGVQYWNTEKHKKEEVVKYALEVIRNDIVLRYKLGENIRPTTFFGIMKKEERSSKSFAYLIKLKGRHQNIVKVKVKTDYLTQEELETLNDEKKSIIEEIESKYPNINKRERMEKIIGHDNFVAINLESFFIPEGYKGRKEEKDMKPEEKIWRIKKLTADFGPKKEYKLEEENVQSESLINSEYNLGKYSDVGECLNRRITDMKKIFNIHVSNISKSDQEAFEKQLTLTKMRKRRINFVKLGVVFIALGVLVYWKLISIPIMGSLPFGQAMNIIHNSPLIKEALGGGKLSFFGATKNFYILPNFIKNSIEFEIYLFGGTERGRAVVKAYNYDGKWNLKSLMFHKEGTAHVVI